MNEYKNFRGRGRGPFHFRGPNPIMFNNGRGRSGNNFAPMLPGPNFRDNKLRWQRPHMNAYNWRPPNMNAPPFHHNARFSLLPPPRLPMPPRPMMPKPAVITRPLSPLPGSEEARQKAIAEASARIKEQLNLNEGGASTSLNSDNIATTTIPPDNKQTQCFVSTPQPVQHDENQHKIPEKITRKRVRKSTNSMQSVDVEELRKKILTQFTYMSKGKIQSLVNNPGSTRYDAALQHLVRDMRLHLSSELRTMYNNRENEYSKENNEMIDHFNSIVPDLGVELVSLPDTMVAELSKILQLDINNDLEVQERRNSSGSDGTLVEPEKLFRQAEKLLSDSDFITMHPFEDEVQMSDFAHGSRALDCSGSATQQAVETMSESAFLPMNPSSVQSSAVFMDGMHGPTTSDYNVNEPVDNLLPAEKSTFLTTQAPPSFLCGLENRTFDNSDECKHVNIELKSDFVKMIPYSEQLQTNEYVDSASECREQTTWDVPCDNVPLNFPEICNNDSSDPQPVDDTDYTVDNIIFNMDDTNLINMDVSDSNLDATDLLTENFELNDNACTSTELNVSNTEFIVNNTNVNTANTNFNIDNKNTSIDKTNLINTVNTVDCKPVQVKQNTVKKKNLINIKLNLNKTNFHADSNMNKDPSSWTMDSSSISLEDITLPPVNPGVSANSSNIISSDNISLTLNRNNLTTDRSNPTSANTTDVNTEINMDNIQISEPSEVTPEINDINHNMNDSNHHVIDINPNMNEVNPNITGINPSPEDTDPFLTKNPLFNPPPSTPRIRRCSPDVRFCNPPFEPTINANTHSHDASELHTAINRLDIDLLDRIANISATLNNDDTNTLQTITQQCQSSTSTVSNSSTLFDFDSVWISKKNLPARQTSVNNSSVNNNINTTENNASKRVDLKSKQTPSTSFVHDKSEENLSRSKSNSMKSINVEHSPTITRSKSHESIYEMNHERFPDSLSDRVPSIDSSRTSSSNHDAHSNSYNADTDRRHNRYKYNRRCRSKSPTDSHRKYKQSLNERIRNMMTVKNDATDKRSKPSKRQHKELYKRKMLEEQNAKFKTKTKRFKVCVAPENIRQVSNIRDRKQDDQIKKKCEKVQKRRVENIPKKKTIGVKPKIIATIEITETEDASKSQEVQKKNVENIQRTQKKMVEHVQKRYDETVLKKKVETVQTKKIEDTQKKTAQNVQNKNDEDLLRRKLEEVQKKKSDNSPKKKANDTQKKNSGDLQSKRIEETVILQSEYSSSYTPPLNCLTSDSMIQKDTEFNTNSLQSSASTTSKVTVQNISSVTNNIDSSTADTSKSTPRAEIQEWSPIRNTERKLSGTPVKTPAQKKEYSVDCSPSSKLVGLKRDIEQNISKLAQTVQNILKTNAIQQRLSVTAPLTTSEEQLTERTLEVTSDNTSEKSTEPSKRTVKLTRPKLTQNDNITDSVNISKISSDTIKSISNTSVNTSNVKANTSNSLRKVNEQIKLNTSERTSKNFLKEPAKEDTSNLDIKEEPESTSPEESNEYLAVEIKEENESSKEVTLADVQQPVKDPVVSNSSDKVNNKPSNEPASNTEISKPVCDTAQSDTPLDSTLTDKIDDSQPKENVGNETQSKEIDDTQQSNKIDNISLENAGNVDKSLESLTTPAVNTNTTEKCADTKSVQSLPTNAVNRNTTEKCPETKSVQSLPTHAIITNTTEKCQEPSNKDENKEKESKDTQSKLTEKTDKTSLNKTDKSNKAEKSSSSRSSSKEKIQTTRSKSVDKEIDETQQSNKLDISLENSGNVDKSLESLTTQVINSNTSEKCPEPSNNDENKDKESKDTPSKLTEHTDKSSVNKIDKSNKTEKSSSSRSSSKEKIQTTRSKSVDKEKSEKVKRKEVSKTDKPRDRSKESEKRSNSVDKSNVNTLKSTNEPKTQAGEVKKLKKKSNKNEEHHNKSPSTKDKETNTVVVKTSAVKKPETKTKSTNTSSQEKMDKPSSHKESPKKTRESDKSSYSKREKDKKDCTENITSIDTRVERIALDTSISTSSPSVNSPLINSEVVVQPIEICIPPDTSCQSRDSILNRLISIDVEIQKLMHEKWNLYKKLQITGMQQVPVLMPNIQVDSTKSCICTESSRKRTLSPSHSEISVGENITSTDSISRTHLSVTPSESSSIGKESEITSKKRRLSIALSESSVTESVHRKTPLEPSRMRQLSVTPTEILTANEIQQIRTETPISIPIMHQQVSNTPSESSITNETSQIRDDTSTGLRQLSVTPSESSMTNESVQIREKTPISDILRPRQLSVTPSESSVTNDNSRKRPLSITPSESSLTEHTESVKNDNDPSDDIDSEIQANKTPKKKRLHKRISPKRKKKKSANDLEDPLDVFVEDDVNNDSNSDVRKFRVKLPNMKTRNKNKKLLDLFTENDEKRLNNRSEGALQPDTNISLGSSVHMETATVQYCKEAEKLEEVPCMKKRNKNKTDNVEENVEQVQAQGTKKNDTKTRSNSKTKKPIASNPDVEIREKELQTETDSGNVKIRHKNKTKQDKRPHLEASTSKEPKPSLVKQGETIPAVEKRGRKTGTSITIELNAEQTRKEEASKKDDVSRKEKLGEIPVIKTRTRTKSRSNTEQSKNEKTQDANDNVKDDLTKPPSKRLKTNPSTDVTNVKQSENCDTSSEDDNVPLLVRVATLFKDNEPEVKPTKHKTKVTKNKNKLIEEPSEMCVREMSTIDMQTRRRSTSLSKEAIHIKDNLKTMKDWDLTPFSKDTVIDAVNIIDHTVSNIQRASSLTKDACAIISETERIVSEQPRKLGRPKSKKKIHRKHKVENISTSEIPIQIQSNRVESVSPINIVVTTPCFVQLERVNIPVTKPDKLNIEEVPMPILSPAIEISPEVQTTVTPLEDTVEKSVDKPIIAEISIVDNTIPSTSKTTDDIPIECHDINVVENTIEPELNTNSRQDGVCVRNILEAKTIENVPVEQIEEVQNSTRQEEPLLVKEIVEEVDLIGDDGIFCMGHQKSILDLKVIGDEFLAASEDGTIYKYCMKTGSLQDAYTGHKKAVTCMFLVNGSVLNIDSPLLYSGSLDCCLKCYNIDTAETVHHVTVEQAIQCMDCAWGHIFLGTYDGLLFIYNMKKKLLHDQSLTIASATVLMIKATTEGSRQVLILASRKREIMVRDAFTGLLLRTMCQEQKPTIYSLYLDRSMVYCGTSDKGILILDFNNGNQIGAYTAGKGVVCMLMYKSLLFAGCYDGMIYVYNTRTQKEVKAIAGPGDGMLLSMAISNNIIIAGTKKDHLLKIWKISEDILKETLT